MNLFSNIGVTELIVILLLALLVVGPERLPELARQLAKLLRDLRKAYENLTRDLGPELMSIQKTTIELRESVDAVRSIPQDLAKSVVQAADLEDTIKDLKETAGDVQQASQALATARKAVADPLRAAVGSGTSTLAPEPARTSMHQQTEADEKDVSQGLASGEEANE